MATTAGLVEPFKSQVEALLAASGGKVTVTSGFRTFDQQVALRKRNGCPDIMHSRPNDCRVTTAIPGTSKHEKGEAVDFGGDLHLAAQLAPQFGLHRTVNVGTPREEMWHYELIPNFKPTPRPPTTGVHDMLLIQITDGPDATKIFLVNGDCRRYLDTQAELDQFVGLLGAPKTLGNAAWQNIVELTALDALGLRSIPPAQYQALVSEITEKILDRVLQDDGPLHQWIETTINQLTHAGKELDYIVEQSGWPAFPA